MSASPLASTVNVAVCPAVTTWGVGGVVIAGPAGPISAGRMVRYRFVVMLDPLKVAANLTFILLVVWVGVP